MYSLRLRSGQFYEALHSIIHSFTTSRLLHWSCMFVGFCRCISYNVGPSCGHNIHCNWTTRVCHDSLGFLRQGRKSDCMPTGCWTSYFCIHAGCKQSRSRDNSCSIASLNIWLNINRLSASLVGSQPLTYSKRGAGFSNDSSTAWRARVEPSLSEGGKEETRTDWQSYRKLYVVLVSFGSIFQNGELFVYQKNN